MKLTVRNAAFALALCGLASCANEAPWGNGNRTGEGSVNLNLTTSNEISSAVPEVRGVSTEIVTPPVEDFQIRMVKDDGTAKTWSSVKDFVDEASFSVGVYTIEAFYGVPEAQGTIKDDENGYEYAYYYGVTEDVTVLSGQTTEVELRAGLANAIVEIEYADEFKSYFKDWQTTLQTDGNSPVNLGSREAMNYVIPGDVAITIAAEQQNGRKLTLNPGKFKAEAKHMYKMRYNIYNGEIGNKQLVIEFDENLEQEPIVIDLSDELGNTEPPQITTEGFENGQNFAALEGTQFNGKIKFNVVAPGQISEASLTIKSDSYKPSFLKDGVIDLCTADASDQSAMEADGIKAIGFFKNPGEFAQLDLTELCKHLEAGEHKFFFKVTDTHAQTVEPVEVSVAVIPKEISAAGQEALYGDGYADIIVSYNGPDPTAPGSNPFSFSIQGDKGFEPVEVISINGQPVTRSEEFPVHDYVYRVAMPLSDNDAPEVKVYFNNQTGDPAATTTIPFKYPDYNIQIDAMAKCIRFKIDESDTEKQYRLYKKIHVFLDGNRIDSKNLNYDDETGIITIPNLTPASGYEIKTTLETAKTPKAFGSTNTVTTESELGVPNGDFSTSYESINRRLLVGGEWRVTLFTKHYTYCTMRYSEPTKWSSVNKKTFYYTNEDNANTWYMVASTYLDNDGVVVRSVAYDHDGKPLELTGSAAGTTYYNTNTPDPNSLEHCAGELFLGSYSYDGNNESRNYGEPFTSRPKTFTFNYKYTPFGEDNAEVEIQLLSSDGVVISEKKEKLLSTNVLEEFSLSMPDYLFGAKASELRIRFVSSTQDPIQTKIPSGNELNEGKGDNNKDIDDNSAHALSVGSVLKLSNLRFNY
ncbi:MAG: DUF4493 domain-containing protein [Muribaculaceae bacterium]|nr:DUF4493 domain-containing protein [Muribaculaceae bacterium]